MLAYISGITKRGNKGITNRDKEISNWRKRNYKSGQELQIGAENCDIYCTPLDKTDCKIYLRAE